MHPPRCGYIPSQPARAVTVPSAISLPALLPTFCTSVLSLNLPHCELSVATTCSMFLCICTGASVLHTPSPRLCNINRHLHNSLASESCRHASGPAIALGEDVLTSASSTRGSPTAGTCSWIGRLERSPTAPAPCLPGGSGAHSASLPPLGAASSRMRCAFPPTCPAVLQPPYTVLRLPYKLAPVCMGRLQGSKPPSFWCATGCCCDLRNAEVGEGGLSAHVARPRGGTFGTAGASHITLPYLSH